MKILIADDEELTRTGVISSMDWDSLGIHRILQADDGIHGLELALSERPEIILCDVRMPRMDGITMLEQISASLPETTFIFMSGYSDKEYLMAAIKLKAVNYIEKPLNRLELENTLKDAVSLHQHKIHSHRVEALHSMETGSRLAHLLTEPGEVHMEEISSLMKELSLPTDASSSFLTMIVQLDPSADPSSGDLEDMLASLKSMLKDLTAAVLFERRRQQYLVFTFVSRQPLTSPTISRIQDQFAKQLQRFLRHYIAVGSPYTGIANAHRSYEEAVILLQSCYFFPSGTILSHWKLPEDAYTSSTEELPTEQSFSDSLNSGIEENARKQLDILYRHFYQNPRLLPNQAKDLYYKLLHSLEDIRIQHQLLGNTGKNNAVSIMERCFSYLDLHKELVAQTEQYFQDLGEQSQENATILMIKDYISLNYMKETLSVKEISSYVFLSTSYVCTFFKNETGKTLNQFITEYRMEKAKLLLSDPRYKITEISSQVGYNDGNYFGKSFKKYSGMSPSEFRERNTT